MNTDQSSHTAQLAAKLAQIISRYGQVFESTSEIDWDTKPGLEKWSKKEIMGHLIDSAHVNHDRFVRIQIEPEPVIVYEQDRWVEIQAYQDQDTTMIIRDWKWANLKLVTIIHSIPVNNLNLTMKDREGKSFSLSFLIEDYITHHLHHLKQVIKLV